MIRKIFIGATLLVALFAAPAAAQYAPLVVTPTVVSALEKVSVSGQGCAPNEEVIVYLVPGDTSATDGIPAGAIEVGRTTADATGNFTLTFTVPSGTAVGVYTVTASCGTLDQNATIEVIATAVTPPPSTPPTLPRTGSNLNGAGMVGAGLLAAGGLVLLASRKRRSSSAPA